MDTRKGRCPFALWYERQGDKILWCKTNSFSERWCACLYQELNHEMGTPLRHISTWHYGQGLSTWASGPGYWYTRSHPNPQNNNCQEEKPTLTRTPAACQLPTSYLLSIRSSPSQSRWSSFRISSWEQPAANSGGTARSFASPRI